MRRYHRNLGQLLPLASIAMVVLLGFSALAVDVGVVYSTRRRMQTAADAAAIAGDIILSRSKRGTRARNAAWAVSSAAEDLSGRWNSMPSAAASSSTARMLPG